MTRQRTTRWTSLALAALAWGCASGAVPTRTPTPVPQPPPPEPEHPTAPRPVRIGVLLPQTGSPYLTQYADLVLTGVRLATDSVSAAGHPLELVVRDDFGSPQRDAILVRELAASGVIAFIGPLLGEGVAAAARARPDSDLVIISPTASSQPTGANVYSLNAGDTRGAEALGEYAMRHGFTRIGVLFPATTEYRQRAQAFVRAVQAAGGRIAVQVPYDSATTTFGAYLERVGAAHVDALFVPASERDIRQLAPQVAYYGLTGVQLLGNAAWVSESVLREVPARVLEGVIAATPLVKESPLVDWGAFVGRYEAQRRQSLDNPFPALGFDAARLLLHAVPAGTARPATLADALAHTADFRGASGILSVLDGRVVRRPFLVRIVAGQPTLLGAGGR